MDDLAIVRLDDFDSTNERMKFQRVDDLTVC